MKRRLSTILSGISGEYFVAGELAKEGYTASLTLKNTKGVDILTTNEKGNKFACIQVKTNTKKDNFWILSKNDEEYKGDKFYYVFVTLWGKDDKPDYYIVPCKEVTKRAKEYFKRLANKWIQKGQSKKDNGIREFRLRAGDSKYYNNWSVLRF